MRSHAIISFSAFLLFGSLLFLSADPAEAAYHFSTFKAHPPIHVYKTTGKTPRGITPDQIKKIYHLPANGGKGTIVIIGAYDDPSIESDLATFDNTFSLPSCTVASHCLTVHKMAASMASNSNWNLETTLDVEWTHAIAPQAEIELVEAPTPSGTHLLDAVDYADSLSGVSAISMSWGGDEFPEETSLDSHFVSKSGASFFASSGDNGTGASWPAASPNVIAVGGTSLTVTTDGSFQRETAWSGSGGGVSAYEKMPAFQKTYSIPRANGMRAIPDVSYNADPRSGYPIVHLGTWRTVGGTSAGAPQWAAIAAIGKGAKNTQFYSDKASTATGNYFRDIVSGTNGSCGYFCSARTHYDYVTGLGSPLTAQF